MRSSAYRASQTFIFLDSSPRRSPACSRTSLTRIDFLAPISSSTHSYSNLAFGKLKRGGGTLFFYICKNMICSMGEMKNSHSP
eukprot:UN08893